MSDQKERALKVLQDFDQIMAEGGTAARHLWGLVSAFRGPDSARPDKSDTTAPLRGAALPLTLKAAQDHYQHYTGSNPETTPFIYADTGGFQLNGLKIKYPRSADLVENDPHFYMHLRSGISALKYFGLISDDKID